MYIFLRTCKRALNRMLGYLKFPVILPEYIAYLARDTKKRFKAPITSVMPCLFENTPFTRFDTHYIYHTAWAARKVKEIGASVHADISSSLYFSGIVSAFIPVTFYDYRPANLNLPNLTSQSADLTNLQFSDNTFPSLSCMHTVEHVGLGWYGDPLDPEGDMKAAQELSRVLAVGGSLLFVVPVGKPRIEFNAHRIYSYQMVLDLFPELTLKYCFGKVLAYRFGKEVKYDTSFFKTNTKYTERPYLLDRFTTTVPVATDEEIKKTKFPDLFSKSIYTIKRIYNKYIQKRYFIGYDKDLIPEIQKHDDLYAEGYWQSYKYYYDFLARLKEEVQLTDTANLEKVKKDIGFDNKISVAVHIRRGDFLNQKNGGMVLEKNFYEKAVTLAETKIQKPTYFIFSDEVEWVKKELGHLFGEAVYPSAYNLTDCEEFILMKDCKHAIIANSTFSWFSTLLSDRQDKVVFYSHDWKNVYLNNDESVCPPHWQGLQ